MEPERDKAAAGAAPVGGAFEPVDPATDGDRKARAGDETDELERLDFRTGNEPEELKVFSGLSGGWEGLREA